MKSVVLYHSKYGATKQYAQWIAKSLNAPVLDAKKTTIKTLLKYDQIIFGGAIYVEQVSGIDLIRKNLTLLKDKKILIFAVGLSEHYDASILKGINLPFYYFRGKFDYKKLTCLDKIKIGMLKKMLTKIENPTKEQADMLSAFNTPVNYVKEENITPLLNELHVLEE